MLLLFSLAVSRTAGFGSPTPGSAFEHVAVMQEPIEHRGDSSAVTEQLAPVFYGPVRCQQRTCSFIASHDDLQQFLGGGQRQLAHSQVVDDQQRHGGQLLHQFLALSIERSIRQVLQQCVGFAIQHTVALLDDGVSDGLGAVALAAPGRTRNMMHITLRWRRFTTVGIRYVASLCEYCDG